MDVPSIYNYQDPALFVTDCYRFIQSQHPEEKYTLRKWAHSMGLEAPQVLVDIIKGKRKIQLKHLDWICRGITLNDSEQFYLRLLIQRENTATKEERLPFDMLLAQLAPSREMKKIYLDDGEIFTDWLNIAIFSFCRIRGTSIDRQAIIDTFEAKAERSAIEAAIERLLSEGLIFKNEAGYLKNIDAEISTTADVPIQRVHQYYQEVFDLAKQAIELSPGEREFQCFAVAIDSEKMPILKRLLRTFRKQVLELSDGNADRVFQVNLQAFPLTEPRCEQQSIPKPISEGKLHKNDTTDLHNRS